MRKDITIAAEPREARGKNEARRLRVRGLTPAVVYGTKLDPVAVAVDPKEVNRILRSNTGHNTIFNVQLQDASPAPVMIVDWQNDPIKNTLLHVDLKRIDLTRRLTVNIPVHIAGEAKGVKLQGGLLEVVAREVEINCLPDEIPEQFTVNVSELMLNQSIRASEIPMAGSMTLISSPDQVIAHVVALRAEEVAEPAAEGAAPGSEPEVIKKGKKEEEAAEPEKKKK
ncbi:MAG TPA: 50S ribosomal protein L25 [Bryobacteraceae bacterium]|jgi:large subunit ribosomal protein L25|nr:50S ribosomal protein L25 [Bryobacteraceae bacterium]